MNAEERVPESFGAPPRAALPRRTTLKRLALTVAERAGMFRLSEQISRRRIIALTYHRIIPRDCTAGVRPPNTLFCDEFDLHMRYVAGRYDVLSGERLRALLTHRAAPPARALVITFDDGYENNFTYALPILQRYGLHAIFFITTRFVGGERPYLWFDRLDRLLERTTMPAIVRLLQERGVELDSASPRVRSFFKRLSSTRQDELLQYLEERVEHVTETADQRSVYAPLSWDQVRNMARCGMTIGSHTENHQILSAVTSAEVSRELALSRHRIEENTGCECWCFGYPNGQRADFRDSDIDAVARAGYLCAFTQIPGSIADDTPRYLLPRVPVPDDGDMTIFRSHVSGFRLHLRRLGIEMM